MDEHDQQDLAHEVAKEYHSVKLDPLLALRIERKNKSKQNTRSFVKAKHYFWTKFAEISLNINI